MISQAKDDRVDGSVSAVIVNWNRPTDTLRCIAALERSRPRTPELVVVDNGSEEQGIGPVAEARPRLEILRMGKNLGFAAGANAGMRHAVERGASMVLLVNDDAEVDPDCLRHLAEALAPGDVAAAGAKIVVAGEEHMVWSAGEQDPSREPVADDGQFDHDRDVDYATGCCLLIKAEALHDVGGFDENFFALFEEVEWCARARAAGWRICYAHRAVARHHLEHSLGGGLSPAYHYLNTRNWLRFEDVKRPNRGLMSRVAATVRVWWHEIKLVIRRDPHKFIRARAVSMGARDYLRRRWGPPPG